MQIFRPLFVGFVALGLTACGGSQIPTSVDEAAEQRDEVAETAENTEETVNETVDAVEAAVGETLYLAHCASCHWMETPPEAEDADVVVDAVRVAPPMHGVMRHMLEGIPGDEQNPQRESVIDFIISYSTNPSPETALCSGNAIERFGMMPPQGELVTPEELRLIAEYLFDDVVPMEPHEPGEENEEETIQK